METNSIESFESSDLILGESGLGVDNVGGGNISLTMDRSFTTNSSQMEQLLQLHSAMAR